VATTVVPIRPSDVVRRATRYLERHGVESPRVSAEILLMEVLGVDRAGLYSRSDGLNPVEARTYGRALCRRCVGTPLQHLTGHQPFRGLDLLVRPGVFVPRAETEVLVEAALELVRGIGEPVVVDVGTGTGAVALAIAQEHTRARVVAVDVSSAAVALASENASRHGLDVTVLAGDLLSPLPRSLVGAVDLIVSNPPYVASSEELPPEVRADPELALFGGTDVHRRIAEDGGRWLRRGGSVAVEIGSTQGAEVRSIFEAAGYADVEVLPDLAMRDRVVVARVPVG
jgi:release factor glutamine methyltransferase